MDLIISFLHLCYESILFSLLLMVHAKTKINKKFKFEVIITAILDLLDGESEFSGRIYQQLYE